MEKKLRRIPGEAVLGGVAAGVADYFAVDKAIVRVLLILAVVLPPHGWTILAYIILWVTLPEGDSVATYPGSPGYQPGPGPASTPPPTTPPPPRTFFNSPSGQVGQSAKILGFGLVALGVIMLLDELPIWYSLRHYFWPVALIAIGAYVLLRQRDKAATSESETYEPLSPTPPPPPAGPVTPDTTWPTNPTPPANRPTDEDEGPIRVN
jgi:phage shock protein C